MNVLSEHRLPDTAIGCQTIPENTIVGDLWRKKGKNQSLPKPIWRPLRKSRGKHHRPPTLAAFEKTKGKTAIRP
jgi:hypothetical protein